MGDFGRLVPFSVTQCQFLDMVEMIIVLLRVFADSAVNALFMRVPFCVTGNELCHFWASCSPLFLTRLCPAGQ